jgi:hypothetical protein
VGVGVTVGVLVCVGVSVWEGVGVFVQMLVGGVVEVGSGEGVFVLHPIVNVNNITHRIMQRFNIPLLNHSYTKTTRFI